MTNSYTSRSDQFLYEYQAWTRLLEFYKQESIFFKTRLSEVIDEVADKDYLALAEQFQNRFIVKDDFINELKYDINAMEAEIRAAGNIITGKQESKQKKIRNEMEYLEKRFNLLKKEFNNYLAAIIN